MSKHVGRFAVLKKIPEFFGKLRKKSSKKISIKDAKKRIDASLQFLNSVDNFCTEEVYDALGDLENVALGLAGVSLEDDFDFAIVRPHIRTVAEYLEHKQFAPLFVKIVSTARIENTEISVDSTNVWSILVVYALLHLWTNFSDISPCLCQQFGASGGVNYALTFASKFKNVERTGEDHELADIFEKIARNAIGILHNCIHLCAENRSVYRKANVVETLCRLRTGGVKTADILLVLTLAYIVNEEESESLARSEDCVRMLTMLLTEAVNTNTHLVTTEDGYYSAMELLDGLNQLAINDSNKAEIARNGGLKAIIRMLGSDFSEEEHVVATQALWNLSFVDSIRRAGEVQASLPALRSLRTSDNQPMREASSYAIWEIQDNQRTVEPTHFNEPPPTYEESAEAHAQILNDGSDRAPAEEESIESHSQNKEERIESSDVLHVQMEEEVPAAQEDSSGHVMISYQWGSQDRVLVIRDQLLQAGYDVWVDVDKIGGDIVDAMADAVEKSSVVLVCMTEKYKDSRNCRSEAKYAHRKKKPIIPLLLEDGYDPDGWLGFLLGNDLYYKFCSDDEMTDSIQGLLKAIGPRGRATAVEKPTTGASATDDVDGPISPRAEPVSMASPSAGNQHKSAIAPIASTWSAEKVQSWLQENELSGLASLLGLSCDGKHLKEMYEQYQRSPDIFQNEMKTELQLSYVDRLKLTTGLRKLFESE